MSEPSRDASAAARSLRVVELAGGVAGQACGRLFADLGHDVLKCEPPGGDPLRTRAPLGHDGTGFTFAALNGGKRSRVVDLATDTGRAELARQLSAADVLIIDFGPSAAADIGLSPVRLRAAWPRLVVLWLTPYGLDDGRSDGYGDSLLAESYGGLAWMIGEPGRPPLSLGGEQAAHAAAFTGLFGAMLALRRQAADVDTVGDVVDVALCDVAAYMDWKSEVSHALDGRLPSRSGASTGPWRIIPAADGWIGVIFQPEQWNSVVALVDDSALGDPALRDKATRDANPDRWWPVLARWAARLPKREIYRQAQRLGLPFGYSADMADLCTDPQYLARGFLTKPAIGRTQAIGAIARSGGLRRRAAAPLAPGCDDIATGAPSVPTGTPLAPNPLPAAASAPLSGVLVLDLGTITAGAATSRLLADYGATVIKIEAPDRPDAFRAWPSSGPAVDAVLAGEAAQSRTSSTTNEFVTSPLFESNNAGKLAITLDLKSDADRAEMARLVTGADVLVENFTVGVTQRLGIDHATLREINPRLIYASLSSQGQSGPEARGRSYGSTLDLLSGLASVTGYPGGGPVWSSADVNYPDQLVSLLAAGLIVHSLNCGPLGEQLDVSQREVVSWTLADRVAEYAESGRLPGHEGNRRTGSTPHDVYPCAEPDHWVAIACHRDADRAALAALIGQPGWAEHPEAWWLAHAEGIDQAIAAWSAGRSREECVRALAGASVPAAPVYTTADRARDSRFRDRRVFLDHPPRKGFPLRMLGYRPSDPRAAPDIGRDNASVLARHSTQLAEAGGGNDA